MCNFILMNEKENIRVQNINKREKMFIGDTLVIFCSFHALNLNIIEAQFRLWLW